MEKFYRVKKGTFLWEEGAILKFNPALGSGAGGYEAIEDIWNVITIVDWITKAVVEAKENEEYFERVYPDTISGKLYKTKDQLVESFKSSFTS